MDNRTCPMQRWLAKPTKPKANLREMLGNPKIIHWQITTTRNRPPMRKVVVACNWGHYFLACRMWKTNNPSKYRHGWMNCETGGPIAQPIHWCDIADPLPCMKTTLFK